MDRLKILFLCTGNSCRSQMAEGWARALKGAQVEPFSAGIETHGMNPSAVAVMAEAGVDISSHAAKLVSDLVTQDFDFVVTVCDHAHESCPLFTRETVLIHRSFPDPPRLAAEVAARGGSPEEELDCYRSVRDQIRNYIESLPDSLYN
jgi:arsenate reductase